MDKLGLCSLSDKCPLRPSEVPRGFLGSPSVESEGEGRRDPFSTLVAEQPLLPLRPSTPLRPTFPQEWPSDDFCRGSLGFLRVSGISFSFRNIPIEIPYGPTGTFPLLGVSNREGTSTPCICIRWNPTASEERFRFIFPEELKKTEENSTQVSQSNCV